MKHKIPWDLVIAILMMVISLVISCGVFYLVYKIIEWLYHAVLVMLALVFTSA